MRRIIIVLLLMSSVTIVSSVATAEISNIYFTPNFQFTNGAGVTNIRLNPTEPVKGWELKILFDPTKIQIESVYAGNFFYGYPTFFSPNMIIDNVNGSVSKLYSLILGSGNKTQDGCLVSIVFTALDVTGISPLSITAAGITNEEEYLPLQTNDATVQVYDDIPPWDTNSDGVVNHLDISAVVSHYLDGCDAGDPWDIRIDGIVNVYDVSVLVSHYG